MLSSTLERRLNKSYHAFMKSVNLQFEALYELQAKTGQPQDIYGDVVWNRDLHEIKRQKALARTAARYKVSTSEVSHAVRRLRPSDMPPKDEAHYLDKSAKRRVHHR